MIQVEEVAVRAGSTSDWASGPVLAAGELGVDNTTGEMKVGDGSTAWAGLRSIAPKRTSVTLASGTKVTADTGITATSVIVPVVKTLGTVTAPKPLVVAKSAGVSFTITSSDNTDTSVLDVLIWY